MNVNALKAGSGRLASLDILRGMDLWLLVFVQPILVAIGNYVDHPWMNAVLYQFDHAPWEGLRMWDIVMPLFLFMTGASMPFSLAKYRDASSRWPVWRKILRRFVILYLCGMAVQGNLLGLDPRYIYLYSNTLQAIAVGYLIGAVFVLECRSRGWLWGAVVLIVIYSVPMVWTGDFTPEGNFAEMVDRAVLGRFRDGAYWDAAGLWHFSNDYHYTWIWSSLTFGVTVLLGAVAGEIMKAGKNRKTAAALRLLISGAVLVAAGCAIAPWIPVIKRLWTSSMTLVTGGICFLLMATSYYWIDCRGHMRGLGWLRIYGMNSIMAYMLGEVVNFRCVVASVSYGLERYMGDWYQVWLTTGNALLIFFILWVMWRHRVFVKI